MSERYVMRAAMLVDGKAYVRWLEQRPLTEVVALNREHKRTDFRKCFLATAAQYFRRKLELVRPRATVQVVAAALETDLLRQVRVTKHDVVNALPGERLGGV